jgi:hypothetical protein
MNPSTIRSISIFFMFVLLSGSFAATTGNACFFEGAAPAVVSAVEKLPYVGNWSNGRGETLSVTGRTLRFNSDKAVTYRDVTKATDGNYFLLEVTTKGNINYFSKYMSLVINADEMKMTLYNSYQDMFDGKNPQGESTWSRDE